MRKTQKKIGSKILSHFITKRFNMMQVQFFAIVFFTAGLTVGTYHLADKYLVPLIFAASSPWTQTSWAGGESASTVSGTVSTYASTENVTVSDSLISLEQFSDDLGIFKGNQLTSGSNFNVSNWTAINWNQSQDYATSKFEYDSGNASRITVTDSGNFLLSYTIALNGDGVNDSGNRSSLISEVRVNGSKVDIGGGRSMYIRNYSGHDESSGHLTALLQDLNPGDYVEIFVRRSTNDTSHSYTADVTATIEELDSSEVAFFGTATRTTASTNLNGSQSELEWNQSYLSSGISHTDGNQTIQLSETGNYLVAVNVPLGGSSQRTNIIGRVKLNGSEVAGAEFKQGYIRDASNHTDSSIHWFGVVPVTSEDQNLSISLEREASSGTVSVDGEKATLFVKKLPADNVIISNGTTLNSSSNWNPGTILNVDWTTDTVIDSNIFAHSTSSDSDEITVLEAGEYVLTFNAGFSSSVQRANPKVTVLVDGSPVTGAESKSGYIRSSSGHNESSNTLYYPLSLEVGQVISVQVEAEGAGGTVNLTDEAVLSIRRAGYSTSGTLVSNIFDAGYQADWGDITYTASNSGVVVKARTDSDTDFSDAENWANCTALNSGDEIGTVDTNCITNTHRYIQYQVSLSGDGKSSPTFEDISIEFTPSDLIKPTVNASDISLAGMNDGDWANSDPTFTWTAGQDNPGGIGLAGYCVSLDEVTIGGSSSELNPETDAGILTGLDDGIENDSTCPFITSGNTFNLSSVSGLSLTSGKQYYFSIKAVDLTGNVFTGTTNEYQDLISFRYDDTPPSNPTYISLPSDFIATKSATLIWPSTGGDAASDEHSGLAGLQYKIGSDGTWYGDTHNGNEDLTDLLTNDGTYSTNLDYDFGQIEQGSNVIYFRAMDNAGNVSSTNLQAALKINSTAPSKPNSLSVSPEDSEENSYEFNWAAPTTFTGQSDNIEYCYTLNTLPTESTCNWTATGQLNLTADAYATQPGENTFYLVAKDEAGNVNYDVYAQIEFQYSGSAPGIPQNLDVADVSVKATSSWKLALSWEAPADEGAGVSTYQIHGSTDGISYSQRSTVTGISYVDTNLDQTTHYYKVRACDSANNCGAYTEAVNLYPDGKFTTPAEITSEPTVTNITTQKATISWVTNRNSDTKIQYGEASDDYFEEEPSKSEQTTSHSIQLSNLSPGKTYFFRAKWTDEDGNTGISDEYTFNTDPAPSASEIEPVFIGLDSANLQFTSKNAVKAKIYFGPSTTFGGLTEISTSTLETTYTVTLDGLQDGTKYFFKVNLLDSEGEEYEGDTNSFTTLPRPQISNVRLQQVRGASTSTVLITWNTNTPITSVVTYYPSANPGQALDEIDVKLTENHRALISGLLPNTPYTLVVKGRDKAGNEATSNPQSFTTATDTRPPTIANLKVEPVIDGVGEDAVARLVVSWDTDEQATAQVAYAEGSTGELTSATQKTETLTFNHVVVVPNLQPSKVYHFKALSSDDAGNQAESVDTVIITPKATDSALNIVVKNLSSAFGFLREVQ